MNFKEIGNVMLGKCNNHETTLLAMILSTSLNKSKKRRNFDLSLSRISKHKGKNFVKV